MICVLEKDLLEDKFIDNNFINNININNRIHFDNNNIFYFGNYKKDKLNIIAKKLLHNKKNINNAIEKGIKIIVAGNSCDLFNNHFKTYKSLNLFNCCDSIVKRKLLKKQNKIKERNSTKIIVLDNLDKAIENDNFKYKNFCYIKSEKNINKIIKKIRQSK